MRMTRRRVLQIKALYTEKQGLAAEAKQLASELEEAKVEAAYERGLRREHQGHAYLLAKERERLLKMLARERCAAPLRSCPVPWSLLHELHDVTVLSRWQAQRCLCMAAPTRSMVHCVLAGLRGFSQPLMLLPIAVQSDAMKCVSVAKCLGHGAICVKNTEP
jgi:hypothetical protein